MALTSKDYQEHQQQTEHHGEGGATVPVATGHYLPPFPHVYHQEQVTKSWAADEASEQDSQGETAPVAHTGSCEKMR